MVKIDRISLGKKGLTRFFSPTEARIMELLWTRKKLTSPSIRTVLDDLSLGCVAGTLDRLVKSGFVNRKLDDNGGHIRYIYSPSSNKKEAGVRISERIVEAIVDTFGESAIDTFGKTKNTNKRKYNK